jgi:hypothetical protein
MSGVPAHFYPVSCRRHGREEVSPLRALDSAPDGRIDIVATSTTLSEFLAFEHNTTEVVDLITALIDGLEKEAWLIRKTPRSKPPALWCRIG